MLLDMPSKTESEYSIQLGDAYSESELVELGLYCSRKPTPYSKLYKPIMGSELPLAARGLNISIKKQGNGKFQVIDIYDAKHMYWSIGTADWKPGRPIEPRD
ncbi:MAG: hypothetical protein GOU99_00425 [Candidatus Altiarchaeota archaeon]|nr:hypothetical protein [Candidatus Altiarchaeota archaeon]